ncbi:ion transporter [bacterium]|nr:ion transporter [bacterium]
MTEEKIIIQEPLVEVKVPKSLKEKIRFYLIDCNTTIGKGIDIFIILLNLLVCVTFVIETYSISKETANILWNIEVIAVIFFIIEYIARLYGEKNRLSFVFSIYGFIDIMAILPTIVLILPGAGNLAFIKALRIFKVFRIFRFLRFLSNPNFFFGKINMQLLRVVRLIVTILIIFFIASGFFYHVENSINTNVETFGDAFYFCVVTLTTVGFGDIIPQSESGRWVTILLILSGIILIPWQASQIVKEWAKISDKVNVICKNCGLKYHDKDASHCKSCGNIIYQEYDGE